MKLRVDFDFLVFLEDGFLRVFLEQEFDLRCTEAHHSSLEKLLRQLRPLHDLAVCGLSAIIEEAEDGRLEHIGDELILFGRERHL